MKQAFADRQMDGRMDNGDCTLRDADAFNVSKLQGTHSHDFQMQK